MSHDDDETRIEELALHAQVARARLKEDVEALAYKLSPENLKREALEVGHDVAMELKAQLQRWSSQANAVAKDHWVELTLTAGFSALLYAGAVKRNRSLLFGALTCGIGAVGALFLRAKARRNERLLMAYDA